LDPPTARGLARKTRDIHPYTEPRGEIPDDRHARGGGYRQADRRDGQPLSADERRWFRSIVQRVAARLALSASQDELYSAASENAFTAAELGIAR